jgi:signal transduction histidine kinase
MGERELLAVHPDPVLQYAKGEGGVGVRRVNAAFEATFGDDGSAVALDDTVADGEDFDAVAAAIVEGDRLDRDVDCVTVDGTRRFRVRNVPDGDDGYLVYTDVSERADRVAELEAHNEQLEAFASVVSHDLRNPISIAERYLDRAREGGDSEDFDRVSDALDRMRTLIDDVLNLAREGQAIEETERVTIESVVEDAWATVETGDAAIDLADGTMTLKTDPSRLRQSFANLFRNAVEHGSTGNLNAERSGDAVEHGSTSNRPETDDAVEHGDPGVTVRVGTLAHDDGFFIEDDGPGIPEDERADVFEPGVTSSTEGTGLGLAIVERVVGAHGWTVTVTEGADGGARFEIRGVDSLQPF